ncbi:MAG: fatty acid desaturase family protein [Cyanothece sp. SIO1E1]|nr:fatty acid desaturase family protein [Cyanothece sp. SIO1E1]
MKETSIKISTAVRPSNLKAEFTFYPMTTSTFDNVRKKPLVYNRHRFSSSIKKDIRQLHKLDNWHGIISIAEDWALIAGAIAVSSKAWNILPSVCAVCIYTLSVVIIGARQRGLRVLNHQATHNALAKNSKLNWLLGTVFASWLVLESFSGFNDSHNSKANGHHLNLGTTKDVDHMAVVQTGLYSADVKPKDVFTYFATLPLQTPKYLTFLLRNRIFNPREDTKERVTRFTYFVVLAVCLIYSGYGLEFLMYWLLPLFTTANWIGSFIQIAEHYPLIQTSDPLDILLSRNRILSPIWNFLVGTHQEGYHLVHHLYPKMPLWNMHKAHRILSQDPSYALVHQETGMSFLLKSLVCH